MSTSQIEIQTLQSGEDFQFNEIAYRKLTKPGDAVEPGFVVAVRMDTYEIVTFESTDKVQIYGQSPNLRKTELLKATMQMCNENVATPEYSNWDGVSPASVLDNAEEVAEATAAAHLLQCTIADLLVINNMDFCDDRLVDTEMFRVPGAGAVKDNMRLLYIDGVHVAESDNNIGFFLKEDDFPVFVSSIPQV